MNKPEPAKQVQFTVPGKPCAKGRPRFTRTGHAYTPEKTASYENLIKLAYMNEVGQVVTFGAGEPVHLRVEAHFPIPESTSRKNRLLMLIRKILPTKKPDLDNVIKTVCDALNGLAYTDDAHVTAIEAIKIYAEEPRVDVVLRRDGEG